MAYKKRRHIEILAENELPQISIEAVEPDLTNGERMSDLCYHSEVRANINVGFEMNTAPADEPRKIAKLIGIARKLPMVWHRCAGRPADQQARWLFKGGQQQIMRPAYARDDLYLNGRF
jgi:hypothetical protein